MYTFNNTLTFGRFVIVSPRHFFQISLPDKDGGEAQQDGGEAQIMAEEEVPRGDRKHTVPWAQDGP